ncbi:hypothetical protein LVB87_15135 [Lysobacter sp. KIS68-7]|uniref:hypothetical protein n=1 Tax=Lysobacter sp. KIS68-7 TaxID=2904252 RepID=UPI001E592007|nr:hypothetical protein [Lysobacter sp. KIS68-7]UHQ19502.1 hypothetical protein LVB87_15135 [Lysobacter sp. KIS68-7]
MIAGRARRLVYALVALALLLALVAYWGTRPERVSALVLHEIGKALGLEITATGASRYELDDGPRLVLRDVVAREPGAKDAVLRAKRIEAWVPWSTVQSGGAELAFKHVELDAPVLDLRALQHWLASRPPSEQKMPTLSKGLQVRDGQVLGDGWSIDALALDVPRVLPGQAVDARVAGRYVDAPTQVPFALNIALSKPANDAALAANGTITVRQPAWRLASQVRLSGPLHVGDGGAHITPLRMSLASRYIAGDTDLPFAFAVNGPLRVEHGAVSLSPAGVALRGRGVVPDFDARAAVAYTQAAMLHLAGTLKQWPAPWPALPPPIGQSTSPLPFVLDYAGPVDFSDIARLQVARDETKFDGRFRLPDVLAWIDATNASPLPPLAGRITTPRLEIEGATLEGVDVHLEDPSLAAP